MYTLRLSGDDLTKLGEALKRGASPKFFQKPIGRRLADALRILIERTPKGKTGFLRKGFAKGFKVRGPLRFELENPAPYAVPMEEGWGLFGPKKRKYLILPKRAKVLAWPSKSGQIVIRRTSKTTGRPLKSPKKERLQFASKVWHPGSKGRFFLKKTLPDFQKALGRGIDDGVKAMEGEAK